MKEGGGNWGERKKGMGNRVRWGWEGLFGVGVGTHHQNMKILTCKEFTMSP